jgi:hypothetical protein
MAWTFGDGFDVYTAAADEFAGYWDTGGGLGFVAGRFAGSQGLNVYNLNGTVLTKASNVNDAVHHLVLSFLLPGGIGGAALPLCLTLSDGATAQCTVEFRTDGAILLCTGGPGGAILATYTGAFTVSSVWYAFEIEVVINNTTGSFTVRKNGNPSNDFTLGGLNTRGGTANNYANRLWVGGLNFNQCYMDDLLWRSDAATVPWVGDVRCYTRMPFQDVTVQFSKSPAAITYNVGAGEGNSGGSGANLIVFSPFTAPLNIAGPLLNFQCRAFTSQTGHINMAIYDATGTGGAPGNLLTNGTATALTNPGGGYRTYTFATPPTLTPGTRYYAAMTGDIGPNWMGDNPPANPIYQLAQTYTGAFPASASAATVIGGSPIGYTSIYISAVPMNASLVSEAHQDGATTYVYDNNVGDSDFYSIGAISITPTSTICVTVRGFMQKSDAGFRQGAIQMKSGSTTVATPSLNLTNGWQWVWRTDTVDPATSTAWTPTAVNNLQVGPTVVA